jgi:hypothetical protein
MTGGATPLTYSWLVDGTNLRLFRGVGDTTLLTIASTGAATFTSSLTSDTLLVNAAAQANVTALIQGKVATAGTALKVISDGNGTDKVFEFTGADGVAAQTMTMLQSGYVGIGTTSPSYNLDVSGGSSNAYIRAITSGSVNYATLLLTNGDGTWHVGNDDTGKFNIGTTGDPSGNQKLTITSGGDVYMGSSTITTANISLYFEKGSGTVTQVFSYSSGTKTIQEYYRQSGASIGSITYNGTITAYNSTSDYRLKEDLKDYNALSIISKLKTYDFKWKEAEVRDYGMMAHELQEVLPSYVNGEKDAINKDGSIKAQGVDYSKIVPILVKGMQEQQAMITSLQEQINELKNK